MIGQGEPRVQEPLKVTRIAGGQDTAVEHRRGRDEAVGEASSPASRVVEESRGLGCLILSHRNDSLNQSARHAFHFTVHRAA